MKATISFLLFLLVWPAASHARWPSFGFFFENDTEFLSGENNDRFYTNGARLEMGWGNCVLPKALQKRWEKEGKIWLPFVPERDDLDVCAPGELVIRLSDDVDVFGFGLRLGQSFYTPDDIDTPVLQVQDRPYGAWLYLGAVISRMNTKHLRSLQLDLGVVGPSAYGEEVQDWVHKNITNSNEAQGWQHQIRDDPVVHFTWDERWRHVFKKKVITRDVGGIPAIGPIVLVDLVPRYYVNLGNVFTQAAAATTFRFGWNVPQDFGPAIRIVSVQPGDGNVPLPNRFEIYGFAALEARAVVHNVFLDGNLFSDSHSVSKEDVVADFEWGFAVRYREVRLTYRRVQRTKEFSLQPESQNFGSVNIAWNVPYKRN